VLPRIPERTRSASGSIAIKAGNEENPTARRRRRPLRTGLPLVDLAESMARNTSLTIVANPMHQKSRVAGGWVLSKKLLVSLPINNSDGGNEIGNKGVSNNENGLLENQPALCHLAQVDPNIICGVGCRDTFEFDFLSYLRGALQTV